MYIFPDSLVSELILSPEGDANLYPAGALVRLYTNNLVPTKNSVLADFTELTAVEVPGYAPVAQAWAGVPVRKQDGSWEDQGAAPLQYKATSSPPAPQIVYGWYMTDAANTVLLASGAFDTPFTFTQNGDGFALEQVFNVVQNASNEYTTRIDMEVE